MPEERDIQVVLNELVRRADEAARRLRMLEGRSEVIESRISSIQDTIIRTSKENKVELSELSITVKKFESELLRLNNELSKFSKNLDKFAKKSEVKAVENTISLLNPITSEFVTRNEVERLIQEHLKTR